MKQVVTHTSTYSSDEFGVCSALYELGGMVVMHDASGCNSTYTTHDEPRWYDMDSMIYISAISEMEAIMGDDRKFTDDLIETAQKLKPRFVALVGAPIPYMTGTDFPALARIVEQSTGIPCFGFPTNGMNYYTKGVSMALREIADRFCTEPLTPPSDRLRVNIIGATPLDLSASGCADAIRTWLCESGMEPGACFAMGSSLKDLKKASFANVNLVVSEGGFEAAKLLKDRFGTPYVVGMPYGKRFAEELSQLLRSSAESGISQTACCSRPDITESLSSERKRRGVIIGECVLSASLAAAIEKEEPSLSLRVLCPLDPDRTLLPENGCSAPGEKDLIREAENADFIIADPLYRALFPDRDFTPLPHTAFSGRIFEKQAPVLIGDLSELKLN